MRSRRPLVAALALAALAGGPRRARGYGEDIHQLLEERSLPADLAAMPLAAPTADDLDLLRRELWRVGSTHPDAEVRARFLARYPTVDAFDAWALKDLLGFNPDRPVWGLDEIPELGAPLTVGSVTARAARFPDADRRNQERFAHDAGRRVRVDRWGQPLPADPRQFDMGSLRGVSSQAYAHYGLPKLEFSTSAEVLKHEPRRFAYPATARAFAAEFAQEHTDLALCAATLGTPGAAALGWLWLAAAHHYLQDVANQIHTLQAIYPFFRDAKIESYKEELRSLGGLLRSRPDFVTIGIGIIGNHHLLAEDLFARRVAELRAGQPSHAAVAAALAGIAQGDGALEQALDARQLGPGDDFGQGIAEALIEASSREGGAVYEAIRAIASPRLSRVGGRFENGMDPDAALRPDPSPAALERFYRLQAAGFARAGSAVRRHVQLHRAALALAGAGDEARRAAFDAAARRLVATQVRWLDERDARLVAYRPRPPRRESINWVVPGALAGLFTLAAGVPILLVRRRRRRDRRVANAA